MQTQFEKTIANLKASSERQNAVRLRQYREEISGHIQYVRNVRMHRRFYDEAYIGGSAKVERQTLVKLREVWRDYRAFSAGLAARR